MKNNENDVLLKIKNILVQDLGRLKQPEDNEYDLVINDYLLVLKKEINRAYEVPHIFDSITVINLSKVEFIDRVKKTITNDDIIIANKLKETIYKINEKFISLINTNYESLYSDIHWDEESEQISLGILSQKEIKFSKLDKILTYKPFFLVEALIYEYFKQSVNLSTIDVSNSDNIKSEFISEEIKDNVYKNLEEYFKILFKKPDFSKQSENQINGVYSKNIEVFNEIVQRIYNLLYGNMRESLNKGMINDKFNKILEEDMCKIEDLINPYFNENKYLNTYNFENLVQAKCSTKEKKWEIYFDKSKLFYYTNMRSKSLNTILGSLNEVIQNNESIFNTKNYSISVNLKRKESEFIELSFKGDISSDEQNILKKEIMNKICELFKRNYSKSYILEGNLQREHMIWANEFKTAIREINLLASINKQESTIRNKRKI